MANVENAPRERLEQIRCDYQEARSRRGFVDEVVFYSLRSLDKSARQELRERGDPV